VAGKTRTVPSWSKVKAKLAQFDRPGLVGLLGDLHNLSRENQAFLHAPLALGADPLAAYKRTISRWVYPDIIRNQDVSVAKAKKAIGDYRKAIGLRKGLQICRCSTVRMQQNFRLSVALRTRGSSPHSCGCLTKRLSR